MEATKCCLEPGRNGAELEPTALFEVEGWGLSCRGTKEGIPRVVCILDKPQEDSQIEFFPGLLTTST